MHTAWLAAKLPHFLLSIICNSTPTQLVPNLPYFSKTLPGKHKRMKWVEATFCVCGAQGRCPQHCNARMCSFGCIPLRSHPCTMYIYAIFVLLTQIWGTIFIYMYICAWINILNARIHWAFISHHVHATEVKSSQGLSLRIYNMIPEATNLFCFVSNIR